MTDTFYPPVTMSREDDPILFAKLRFVFNGTERSDILAYHADDQWVKFYGTEGLVELVRGRLEVTWRPL